MRPDGVVVLPPGFYDGLGLFEGVEDLTVQQFVALFSVEGFTVIVLSGAPRLDARGLGTDCSNPFPERQGNELSAVIRTDMRILRKRLRNAGQARLGTVRGFELGLTPGVPQAQHMNSNRSDPILPSAHLHP